MKNCECCGKETNNPKFCSHSCSAKISNKRPHKIKRKKRFCRICGKDITYYGKDWTKNRKTVCDQHNPYLINWSKIKLKNRIGSNGYNRKSDIWGLARIMYIKSHKEMKCAVCGYKKHVQICHIKPVRMFDKNTPVSIVNSLNNLIALCPNHHWELDHQLLKL